jgi:hypothetical protein
MAHLMMALTEICPTDPPDHDMHACLIDMTNGTVHYSWSIDMWSANSVHYLCNLSPNTPVRIA